MLSQVVSTDHAGTVCCWDLQTGQLLHSFGNAHGAGCRISTAALDEDCRRLITGVAALTVRWHHDLAAQHAIRQALAGSVLQRLVVVRQVKDVVLPQQQVLRMAASVCGTSAAAAC